jgi:hypothetical protein
VFLCRGEKIEDYVDCIAPGYQPSSKQTHESCIQGYGGESSIDRDDETHKDITQENIEMILGSKYCARTCLLDSKRLTCSSFSPGTFKRHSLTQSLGCQMPIQEHINSNFTTFPLRYHL